jgi:hypothetical protein
MRASVICAALAAALAASPAAFAQTAPAAPAAQAQVTLDAHAVVAEVRRIIAERYVLPERRPVLDAALARALAAGRYDVADPGELAERINADLAEAGHDRHLNFHFNPQAAADIAAQSGEDAPDDAGTLRRARAANHGITELKLLPGNIRYMRYDLLWWTGAETEAALANAMRFLAGGDAVIIDLRGNGGGSPEAVQYIISHFLPAGTPLVTFYMNGRPEAEQLRTLAELPAGRMVGRPLYVLTSGRTGSAAEELAGHVGGYRIGELIGSATAGAGFRNDVLPVAGGFVLSVSVGRAVLASTGRDWEAVGISPTTEVTVDQALDVARLHALRRLAAAAPAPEKARLEAMAAVAAAQLEPVATALPLAAYAGRFGERNVAVENGRLVLQRANGPALPMVAIGPNLFAFEGDPSTRLSFAVAGDSVTGFELTRNDGSQVTVSRTP